MKKYGLILLSTGPLAWLTATPVFAQDTPSVAAPQPAVESEHLDDIVVTARKRAAGETLQSIPISATALGEKQLTQAFVQNLTDVGRMAPNVTLQPSSQRGAQNFEIRGMGVSGTTPSDEPTVGVFQDGVYWGSNYGALGDLLDVEAVEILRGPQGTLFGRNVTGGAVIVRSAPPTADASFRGTVGVGTNGLLESSAVINGPLSGDVLMGRIAVQYRSIDGYFHNSNTNKPYGESDDLVIRPSLKIVPAANFNLILRGELFQERGDPVVARGISPSHLTPPTLTLPEREGYVSSKDFWVVAPNDLGFNKIDVLFGAVEANWDVLGGVLTSVTGYRKVRTRVQTDFDGTPSSAFLQNIGFDQHQVSSELRFAGKVSDIANYTVGVYYFDQSFAFRESRDLNNHATRLATRSTLDNESFAAFAEGDIEIVHNLKITAGARYTTETKTASTAPFGACTFNFATCTFGPQGKTSNKNFSPKFGISYQPASRQLVFASVTRGFRSGGFGLRGTVLASPYRPETVTAYELGYKGDLIPDRLRLNVSLFRNKYNDLQRTVLAADPALGVIQNVFNAAKATIEGAEAELTVVASDHLTLSANYGHTQARYKTFLGVANPGARRFVRVPENVGAVSATYTNELGNGGRIDARASASYSDGYFFDDANTLSQGSYTLVDANLGYTLPSGKATFSVWGKNLAKAEYSSYGSSLGALGQNVFPGPPRTGGVRMTVNF